MIPSEKHNQEAQKHSEVLPSRSSLLLTVYSRMLATKFSGWYEIVSLGKSFSLGVSSAPVKRTSPTFCARSNKRLTFLLVG